MKRTVQTLFLVVTLFMLLPGLVAHTTTAKTPYTAFSIWVTDGDSNTGVGYAEVTVSNAGKDSKSLSTKANLNGIVVLNLSFAPGEEKSITATSNGRKGHATVKEQDEGNTIRVPVFKPTT